MIDWFLPGTKAGGPVRSIFSLLNVINSYFDFYLITTNTDLGISKQYEGVTANTLFLKDNVHYYYFTKDKISTAAISDLINKITPDLIYLNSVWSYLFSIAIVRLKKKGEIKCPVLLAPRGMLGRGALGLKSAKKQLFLLIAKILGVYKTIIFHATQKQEESDIKRLFKRNKILIAPNLNSGAIIKNVSGKAENQLTMFYLSRIARVKNLHYALNCLRDISDKYKIEYNIFGNLEDQDYWSECQQIIRDLPAHIKVNYKSELSFDQVQNTIKTYNVFFLPTLNENFGHSIVESLLCGCPVIISDQTPWTDLQENEAGYSLPLLEKNKFVQAIEHYANMTSEQFQKVSTAANNYISKKIDLQKITKQYQELFDECIKN